MSSSKPHDRDWLSNILRQIHLPIYSIFGVGYNSRNVCLQSSFRLSMQWCSSCQHN
jgi:hypothetical protein